MALPELSPDFVALFEKNQYRSIYDMHVPGRRGISIPELTVLESELPPADMLRSEDEFILPEVGQLDVIRYFTFLSSLNYSIEKGMYPLGSCTMKYNPKINDEVAGMPGLSWVHPEQPVETIQGSLRMIYELRGMLKEITGMDEIDLTPMAGAQGELTGILTIKVYHRDRGEDEKRNIVLVPDSSHGTNPATAAMAGYEVIEIKSDQNGNTDLEHLRKVINGDDQNEGVGKNVAAMMLTFPSTLGLFDQNILEIADLVHGCGALLYGDGANMNALVGRIRPGDLGFDVMHMNLHKTFSTPHGGGGPGAGPIAVRAELAKFLPGPLVEKDDEGYLFVTPEKSFGRMGGHFGNFGIYLRAYVYILSLGADGLREISGNAVLNANYLGAGIEDIIGRSYGKGRYYAHEVVVGGRGMKNDKGITMGIAKRLIDYGFHPPTYYFPHIVDEAMMIEPTESETKEGIDLFNLAMRAIAVEAKEHPELLNNAPHNTPVGRLDEGIAARKPILTWRPPELPQQSQLDLNEAAS